MGITSENVAQHFGVTREEQDYAAVSFEFHQFALTVDRLMQRVVVISFICANRLSLIGVLPLHLHLANSKMKSFLFILR